MKVTFVFAPYSHKKFEENIYVVDEDFGVFPPLNVAYAAAIAERAGHDVSLIDANALLRLGIASREQIIEEVAASAPDVIGLYFSTYMFRDTLRWARALKSRMGRPIIAGGINTLIFPGESLANPVIDYAVLGHAHESLPRLLDALESGRGTKGIDGVLRRGDDEAVIRAETLKASTRNRIDFDSFPLPARHLLQNSLYYSFISQRKNFTIAMTTLGCRFGCDYCAIAPLPTGERSVENVMAEIDEVYNRYSVREIDFFDASFVASGDRTSELLDRMASTPSDLEFTCRARIDEIDEKIARALGRAGFRQIYLGIESSELDILRRLNKQLEPNQVHQALAHLRREGVRVLGFFMLGSPGETFVTAIRTILFALTLDLDYAQFSRTIAKPNTGLDRHLQELTGKNYWRDYVLGDVEERRIATPWTELTERQIELLTKFAYILFYYRPRFILKTLRRVRSPAELHRFARTAARMLLTSSIFD